MSIGENIKRVRKSKKISQSELGKLLGVSQAMIAQYENGQRIPKIETINNIAEALSVNIDALYKDKFILPIRTPQTPIERMNLKIEILEEQEELIFLNTMSSFHDMLNKEGRNEAVKRVQELTEIPKYQKDNDPLKEK